MFNSSGKKADTKDTACYLQQSSLSLDVQRNEMRSKQQPCSLCERPTGAEAEICSHSFGFLSICASSLAQSLQGRD